MARIQIEYTANVSQLQASLDRIIDRNRQIASSARQASLAMGQITQSIAGASGGMQNLASSMRGATAGMTAGMRNLNTQLQQLQRQTSGLNNTMSTLSSNMSRIGTASQSARGSVGGLSSVLGGLRGFVASAFAVNSIVSFGKEIVNLTAKIELLQSRLAFIYGGAGPGEAAFIRLSSVIRKLGLEFESTMEQATAFSIAAQQAGYTTTETEKMFVSFASALRASGASSLQVQRSFYALQQMMSKGVVSAEELNRQMGESLPGAAMLMFKAMKNLHPELVQTFEDFRKLQKEGKIISAEVLPEFIRVVEQEFAPALAGKTNSLSASLNRLSQAFAEFKLIIFPQEMANAFIKGLSGFIDHVNTILSSENLSALDKLATLYGFDPKTIQKNANIAYGERGAKEAAAMRLQNEVAKEMKAFGDLTLKQQQERLMMLDKEIEKYNKFIELSEKANKQGISQLEFNKIRREIMELGTPTLLGEDMLQYGSKSTPRKYILSLAQEIKRNMLMSMKTEDDTTDTGEDPRVKAIQDEINLLKAKIMAEEDAIKVINEKAEFEIKTTETLVSLKIKLAEVEEKLALLKASGAGETALAMAKKESEVLQQQIELRQHEEQLMIDNLELQKMIIEQRLLVVKEGSMDEYRLREQLLRKNQSIEILKAKENSELVKKITADTNAAIKKMYEELAVEVKDFMAEIRQLQEEPFMDEMSIEADKIIKQYDKAIADLKDKFEKNILSAGGFTQFDTTQTSVPTSPVFAETNILAGIADQAQVEKIKKAREELEKEIKKLIEARDKLLQELGKGDEGKSFLGLDPDELQKLKKIADAALNIFSDYYAARTEIAKNALQKEQALLDKKFEAGLIRENEYNEETKKNKEEMAKLDRDAARFGVLINTAQAIIKLYTDFDAITASILAAGVVAVGATQLSAINSAPLPEFHEGGLDIKSGDKKRPDNGLKQGEFYAKLLEGESVMTREQTAKYKDVLKAIREDSLPLQIMKGYTAPAYHRSMDEPYRMAKEQTSLELAFQNAELVDAIKRNGAVAIKNADELADAIVSKSSYTKITNRRRIR